MHQDRICPNCKKKTQVYSGRNLCHECACAAADREAKEEAKPTPEIHLQGTLSPDLTNGLVGILRAAYPREAKPTDRLHTPSLCPLGGCPACETVSDK